MSDSRATVEAAVAGRWLLVVLVTVAVGGIRFAVAAEAAAAPSKQDSELVLEGSSIEELTLASPQAGTLEFKPPPARLRLAPGEYWIHKVVVKGGFAAQPSPARDADRMILVAGESRRIQGGAPLVPRVAADRRGSLLRLGYRLEDAQGRQYSASSRDCAPQFSVYCGDRQVGTGTFEYG